MVAAATTAAAAPDVLAGPPPAPFFTDAYGGWRSGYFFTFAFPDNGTSQWLRFRLPWPSLAWGVTSHFFDVTGSYVTAIYISSDPDEDGSTLELFGQWPYIGLSIGNVTTADAVWIYMQVSPAEGWEATDADLGYAEIGITVRARATGRTTVTAGHRVAGPLRVNGSTWVGADPRLVPPTRVFSFTYVRVAGPVHPRPQPVLGWSACIVWPTRPTGDVIGVPTPARGSTVIRFGGERVGTPDDVIGVTVVSASPGGDVHGRPELVSGSTTVHVQVTAELTDNPPIQLAFSTHAELRLVLPEDDSDPIDVSVVGGPLHLPGNSARRTMPIVSFHVPTPIVVAGKPYVPRWHAYVAATAKATQGTHHIRAADPAPKWDPVTGGWTANPPDLPWDGRWVVDDLPDPPDGGYYWLGDASSADGTGGYKGGRTRWSPHASTPTAPEWRSFFPYKPSVRAYDSYLPDGGVVHHPKGVHLNSQFVEHMWADFGGPRRQPFTWVIAGMIAGWPSTHYRHYLLDAGRNPDKVSFPRLSDTDVYQPHTIHDGLDYRSLIAYSRNGQILSTRNNFHGPHHVRARVDPHRSRPKMFFGVFNGADSYTGAFGPNSKRIAKGRIDNGPDQHHRYYVIGRAQGAIDQDQSSHVLIFEIRYWRHPLTRDQLEYEYHQLASTYHFHRYRRV